MMYFCSKCGKPTVTEKPDGDDRPRQVCRFCNTVHYENPKMVVGCIPQWEEKILLCRRAIEPRYGKWTLPAGFLEMGETVAEGARRETLEEACARVDDLVAYALYNLSFISQVYIMFRGRLLDTDYQPGNESLTVELFRENEIPWIDLAFPVVEKTLKKFFRDRKIGKFPFFMGDINPS